MKKIIIFVTVFVGLFAQAIEPLNIEATQMQSGLSAQWIQLKSSFVGKSEESKKFYGIWKIEDAFHGFKKPNEIVRTYTAIVDQIDYADNLFNYLWSETYGESQLVPMFATDGDFLDKYPDQGYKRKPLSTIIDLVLSQKSKKIMNNQNDYISIFSGFLYIPAQDEYEFWVLSDDGYQFTLSGLNSKFEMSDADLEPLHPRTWFSKKVKLKNGFYALNLSSFDHLEASVIRLAWRKVSESNQQPKVIQVQNLFHFK